MRSIKDYQITTVSKDHLVQKHLWEIQFLKASKTLNKHLEISQILMEEIKTQVREETILENQKIKDFLIPNQHSINKIKEETWINGSQNPNIF